MMLYIDTKKTAHTCQHALHGPFTRCERCKRINMCCLEEV